MPTVEKSVSLKSYNTFAVDVSAQYFAEVCTPEDIRSVLADPRYGQLPRFVLGGGSNTLFTKDFEGLVLHMNDGTIEVTDENDRFYFVKVSAGIVWDDFVRHAIESGWYGIENLAAIPGTVGGAAVQNIGAYGCEAKDAIERVHMFCVENCKCMTLDAAHCCFGYRESIFKHDLRGRVVITAVDIRLSRTPQPRLGYGDVEREVESRGGTTLRNIREAICAIRRAKLPDPKVTGNAGSFFKNPVVDESVAQQLRARWPDMPLYPAALSGKAKLAAGWLIDKAGLKGCRSGRVGIHERQALVLVNLGGATGGEILDFARMVQARVHEKFGIEIDTEVNIL